MAKRPEFQRIGKKHGSHPSAVTAGGHKPRAVGARHPETPAQRRQRLRAIAKGRPAAG